MRHIIVRESGISLAGRVINVGALIWASDATFPVFWNFESGPESILARASDLRRVRDGYITAEISLFDRTYTKHHPNGPAGDVVVRDDMYHQLCVLLENKDVGFTVYASNVEKQRVEDVDYITRAVLRSVSVIPLYNGANPGGNNMTLEWGNMSAADVED